MDEEFKTKADKNVIDASKSSAFSFEEKKIYFKKKWRKEHISLFIILFLICIASLVIPFILGKPHLVALSPLIVFIEYGYQNNKMMIYVENNLYD